MKHAFAALLALCLLFSLLPIAAETAVLPEGFAPALENQKLALYAREEDGQILLLDRVSGKQWFSNPAEEDSRARGVHRQTLLSQITVGYSNERGTALNLTSAADAVRQGGLSLDFGPERLTATYDFAKAGIRVRLVYELAADHLKALLPVDGLEVYETQEGVQNLNTVTAVDILPVFGAGGPQDEGWLLVPDGSGALIRFNNGVTSMAEYAASLYGKDAGVEGQVGLTATLQNQARIREQTARLPVFGVHHAADRSSLLAIITQNDAKATVLARVSNLTSYNYAWSRFKVLNGGSMMMNSKEFGASVIGVSERAGLTTGTYEVRYYPLSGEQATTAGMAACYRDYLIREQGLEQRVRENEYPLYLELYGQVKKPAQFLGIPYTKTYSLTTLEDIRDITAAIGVPQAHIRYADWLAGSGFDKIPERASLSGRLGRADGLRKLQEELAASGGGLYPAADLLNVYRTGRGFWPIRDAVLAPVNAPQLQFELSPASRAANPAVAPWYLLSPARYERFFTRFFDSYKGLGLPGLALDAVGDILTSDNRSGGTGRGQVPAILRETLQSAGKELMLTGGNAYAASLARHLLSTPGGHSGYTLTDTAIPFYQMVFHGYIPYGIGTLNHSADPATFLLRCLEYGASPQFTFAGQNIEELAGSRLSALYSPDYRAWAGDARAAYEELAAVLQPLALLPITRHEPFPGGALTVYGGRTAVYVNYTAGDIHFGGLTIPAGGYLVKEGAQDGQ